MTTLGTRAEIIRREIELITTSLAGIINPKADLISQREAGKCYGAAWLRANTENGNLQCWSSGAGKNAKKTYSRTQIACLRAAEAEDLDKVTLNIKKTL